MVWTGNSRSDIREFAALASSNADRVVLELLRNLADPREPSGR